MVNISKRLFIIGLVSLVGLVLVSLNFNKLYIAFSPLDEKVLCDQIANDVSIRAGLQPTESENSNNNNNRIQQYYPIACDIDTTDYPSKNELLVEGFINKRSGWKGRHLFHLTIGGKLVEGHVLLRGTFQGFPFHKDPNWSRDGKSSGKLFRFKAGKCYWCPYHNRTESNCIYGHFYAGWYKDDHTGSPSLYKFGHESMLRLRPMTILKDSKRIFFQVYMRCELESPAPPFQEGVLRVQNLTRIVQLVNPGDNTKVTVKDTSAVCAKGIYGKKYSTNTVVQFVRHYLENWKIDKVVLYEIGLTRAIILRDLIERIKILRDYYLNGRLIIIDIRDSMQRMYGAIGMDPVLFSVTHGQLITFTDCMMRAKFEGFEWVLNVDHDELLTFGVEHSKATETFADLTHRQEQLFHAEQSSQQKRQYPLRVLQFSRRFPIQGEDSPCEECGLLWDQQRILDLHREKEAYNKSFESWPGKSAYRVNSTDIYPLTNTCGIHTIAGSGAFEENPSTLRTKVVNQTDVYFRHYSCLNRESNNCEYMPKDMPEEDDWALVLE